MSREFKEFLKELDQEARRGGPKAVAELAAFDAHHRLAREAFDLRKKCGMTQRQLASKAGLQQAEISRIEAGNSNPTLSTIAALALALGAELSLRRTKATRAVTKPRATGRRLAPARAAARRAP